MRRLILLSILLVPLLRAEPEYPKQGPDIYDTKADGSADITRALGLAQAGHKRVLLKLGANWCIWCRRLAHTLETEPALREYLDAHYVLVRVDVNQRQGKNRNAEVNARYGNPVQHGLPVLLVLDADGRLLTTQETGALEDGKDGHDAAKVLAFLKQWAPPQ